MRILAVRHGQTQVNAERRVNGQRIDPPLNSRGIKQVTGLASNLPPSIRIIVSSPLVRARQTTEIINKKLNLPVIYDDALKERDFGSLTGMRWNEVVQLLGSDIYKTDIQQHYNYRFYGGESVDDVRRRLLELLNRLLDSHASEMDSVLLVTSAGIIRLMLHFFYNEQRVKIEHAQLYEFLVLKKLTVP